MLRFYYDKSFIYSNRRLINLNDNALRYTDIDYATIDTKDSVNGHIIYVLEEEEPIPTYVLDLETGKRWFVSGISQLRPNKYQISLLRDVASEKDDWKYDEAFIECGTATDFNKYKTWGLPFTNTKISEERLNFSGKSSFFVFYVNEAELGTDSNITEKDLRIKGSLIPDANGYDFAVDNIQTTLPFKLQEAGGFCVETDYLTADFVSVTNHDRYGGNNDYYCSLIERKHIYSYPRKSLESYNLNTLEQDIHCLSNGMIVNATDDLLGYARNKYGTDKAYLVSTRNISYPPNNLKDFFEYYKVPFLRTLLTDDMYNKYMELSKYQEMVDEFNNKYILDKVTKKVYYVSISKGYNLTFKKDLGRNHIELQERFLNYKGTQIFTRDLNRCSGDFLHLEGTFNFGSVSVVEVSDSFNFDFTFQSNRRKLIKSNVRCINIVPDDKNTFETIGQCLSIAQANPNMGEETKTTGKIIDIQYLPFSVAKDKVGGISINNENLIASYVENDDLYFQLNLPDLTDINKETDTIRIVSPSRATQYQFSPYNNDGNMEFSISVTLRPVTSTIYVRPSTKGLLMYDYNDKEGLIINEDFSITQFSSAWTTYVQNNINYQNIFDREIKSKEVARSWQIKYENLSKKNERWQARLISSNKAKVFAPNDELYQSVFGSLGLAFKDKFYMDMAQLDRDYNLAMYTESVSLAKDMFSYQLDNIQSQPLTPSKVSSLDCKTLDGIYLEYYSTNDTEKIAIENYYKYNGNRIDCYGKFINYYGDFIKGKIIKSSSYNQPELFELNRRLELGIYTK